MVGVGVETKIESTAGPKYILLEHEHRNPIEAIWEVPNAVRGVIFLAHGCQHGAVDFWPKSEACPKCVGLPEEVQIVKEVLARGYAVIAVSSLARNTSKCWHVPSLEAIANSGPGPGRKDIDRTVLAIRTFVQKDRLHGLPLYAMGASSGGAFVLFLASNLYPRFTAVCSQIMGVPYSTMDALVKRISPPWFPHKYPATMFVHMAKRDPMTAEYVKESLAVLNASNVATREILVDPTPLSPTYFSDRIGPPEITPEQSQAIYEALRKKSLIDDTHFLTEDPRHTSWRQALLEAAVPGVETFRLQADLSPISEELNVAWAGHEIVAAPTQAMLDWFETLPSHSPDANSTLPKPV